MQAIVVPSYQTLAAARQRLVTQFAFRTRVGDVLVAQLELAATQDAGDDAQTRPSKAARRAAMARCFSAAWLDLDSAELQAGFADVPQADYDRIFLTPVSDAERP